MEKIEKRLKKLSKMYKKAHKNNDASACRELEVEIYHCHSLLAYFEK